MSVRFASANHPARRLAWRAARRGLLAPALARAANDNGETTVRRAEFDPMLVAALRHFAVHGLAAADAALEEATAARLRGDGLTRARWLAITRLFDRRLVERAAGLPPGPARE